MLVGIRMQTKMTTFVVFTAFLVISMSTEISGNDGDVLQRTMPAYTIAKNAHLLPASSRCRYQLEKLREGIDDRKLWSLRMLDASGAPKPGFVYGNNFWIGSQSQCHDTNNPEPVVLNPKYMENITLYRNPEEETPPYLVHYFAAKFTHNGTVQYQERLFDEDVIVLGLCLPDICRSEQLSTILEKIFRERELSIGNLYSMDFTLLTVKDLRNDPMYVNWRVIATGVILLVTLLMVIIGTCYDLRVHQKRLERNKLCGPGPKLNVENGGPSNPPPPVSRPSAVGAVVLSFSAYTNSKFIFDTSDKREMTCLDGLRFFSMGWVLIVHTVLYGFKATDNSRWQYRLGMELVSQIISNGSLSVDTFFFLSGFLVAYIFLKTNKPNADKPPKGFQLTELIEATVKRFIRLTPPYLMVIGFAEMAGGYFNLTSQFSTYDKLQESCSQNWWANLLYINNIPPFIDVTCLSWSWYLSDDMQFFIVATILLLISRKYLYTSVGISVIIILSSLTITGYTVYTTEYVPTIEELFHSLTGVYALPWLRIGPYMVGLGTSYLVLKMKNKVNLNKKTVWLLWTLGAACNIVAVFGLYDRKFYFSPIPAAIFVAVFRTLWSIGVGWIVFACLNNYGGIINSLLSFKAWMPGSKLTYCAYLLNPLIIQSYYLSGELPLHVDFIPNLVLFLGFIASTFIFAYIHTLLFEMPYMNLIKLYYMARRKT
ncbi:nose resistant to fluoxetine protein 6 [Diachasma alloeum]|uniref:nose resistant to fluoxetine protein 6 n=1 Tax=Diachasma alloeum TaxID=454923 RepID=UPI000738112F|nr:nose resistant to fluoxetine protein 6 [Diachasma alloeum]